MLSFQARKKDDQYLMPVYSYMNGGAATKSTSTTPTQNSSIASYATQKPASYIQNYSKPVSTSVYKPYANTQSLMRNPGTYTTPTTKPITPTVDKPKIPTADTTQPPSAINKLQTIGTNRQNFYQSQADTEAARQAKLTETRNNFLKEQVPFLENKLNNYRTNSAASIANQEKNTQLVRDQVNQDSGEEMRLNAQTAREGRGRVQSTLAGLNALDSSVTAPILAKAEGNLANNQATALRQRNLQLGQADQTLLDYKTKAKLAEDDEVGKFNEAIRSIVSNMDINSSEGQAAAKAAYDKATEAIYGIEEGIAKAELDVQSIYDKAYAEQDAKNMTAGASNNNGKALQMVNDIIGGNYQGISGGYRPGAATGIFGALSKIGGAGNTQAKWEGLSNLLTLARRGELKGSGQVSDFETKMLTKAALAGLDPTKQTEEEFLAGLKQLQSDLQAGGAVDNRSQMVTMMSPDGQSYQVDQSEVKEATANGWRAI